MPGSGGGSGDTQIPSRVIRSTSVTARGLSVERPAVEEAVGAVRGAPDRAFPPAIGSSARS